MEKKWMIPALAAVMSLSLVGCGTGEMDSRAMTDGTYPGRTSTYNAATHGSKSMMDDAKYYASRDGELPKCDSTQERGCEMRRSAERATDDVERAMRDVGKTMDQMLTPKTNTAEM